MTASPSTPEDSWNNPVAGGLPPLIASRVKPRITAVVVEIVPLDFFLTHLTVCSLQRVSGRRSVAPFCFLTSPYARVRGILHSLEVDLPFLGEGRELECLCPHYAEGFTSIHR